MNLRELEYLVAVADLRHFGRAARACHVTQPTLSMQLRKLEDLLGVQLFERDNRRVLITPVGEEIVRRARAVLTAADDIRAVARNFRDPFAGDCRIGAFPTVAPYLLPRIVPAVVAAYPQLKLMLFEEKTPDLLEKLAAGQLDCAILALPIADDRLETIELFEDKFRLAIATSHPLAARPLVTRADLKGEQLMLLEDGHCLRGQALEVCSMMGAFEYSGFRATSLETLRQMVASGLGITLVPELAIRENDGISYVPFDKPRPSRTIGLAFRRNAPQRAVVEAIAIIVRRTVTGVEPPERSPAAATRSAGRAKKGRAGEGSRRQGSAAARRSK